MFVDASALTAILADEPDRQRFVNKLEWGGRKLTSALAVWETAVAVARVFTLPVPDAQRAVRTYLAHVGIDIVAIESTTGDLALDAFDRFGKGRHPARLNMGDCFAYACAKHHGMPLLYKGGDFAMTDIDTA